MGKTVTELTIDVKAFEAGLKKAEDEAFRASGNISKALNGIKTNRQNLDALGKSFSDIYGPAVKGFGVAAVAVAGFGKAIYEAAQPAIAAEKHHAKLAAILKATGYSAGVTATELKGMAEELASGTEFTKQSVTDAAKALATVSSIRGENFKRATADAVDMAAALGTDAPAAAERLAKALQAPEKAAEMLRESHVVLSSEQDKAIAQFVKMGDTARAQGVILAAVEKQFKGAGKSQDGTTAGAVDEVARSWEKLKTLGSEVFTPFVRGGARAIDAVFKPLIAMGKWMGLGGDKAKEASEKAAAAQANEKRRVEEAAEAYRKKQKAMEDTLKAIKDMEAAENKKRDEAAGQILDRIRSKSGQLSREQNAIEIAFTPIVPRELTQAGERARQQAASLQKSFADRGMELPEDVRKAQEKQIAQADQAVAAYMRSGEEKMAQARLHAARGVFGDERTKAEVYSDDLGQLQKALKDRSISKEFFDRQAGALKEQAGFATPLEQARRALADLDQEYDAGLFSLEKYQEKFLEIKDKAFPGASTAAEKYAVELGKIKTALDAGVMSQEAFNEAAAGLKASLFGVEQTAGEKYSADKRRLDEGVKAGAVTETQRQRRMQDLREQIAPGSLTGSEKMRRSVDQLADAFKSGAFAVKNFGGVLDGAAIAAANVGQARARGANPAANLMIQNNANAAAEAIQEEKLRNAMRAKAAAIGGVLGLPGESTLMALEDKRNAINQLNRKGLLPPALKDQFLDQVAFQKANATGATALWESTRTNQEKRVKEEDRLQDMFRRGFINQDLYSRGMRQVNEQYTPKATYEGLTESYKRISAAAASGTPEQQLLNVNKEMLAEHKKNAKHNKDMIDRMDTLIGNAKDPLNAGLF